MATTQHVHVRSDHVGLSRWPASFIAAGVAAVACAVVATSSITGSGDTVGIDLAVEPADVVAPNLVEPVSALLDGRAFAAVQAGIAGIPSPSILLDGAAFEQAVHGAVAFVINGSALLHGTGFAEAVARAFAAAGD